MNFDSADEYLSCSDSSVCGWDNKEVLSAIDYTLLELSHRKQANMPNHMKKFLHEQRKHKHSIDAFTDTMAACHDVQSIRDRLRQVRFQLAMQKKLIDQDRDRSLERAAVRRAKDEMFLSSDHLTLSVDNTIVLPRPQIQISVPQHFSEKQSRRLKSQGVTAWDGSQYMMTLLFSLRDKLLLKFCFLFLRDRANLWTMKKTVADKMYESKCRMLMTESFAGLKVSWLQDRHDRAAKSRGKKHFIMRSQLDRLMQWKYISRRRKYYRRLYEVASVSHISSAVRRSWALLHLRLLSQPRKDKKQLCSQIISKQRDTRRKLSRHRKLSTVPRPRLELADLTEVWNGDVFSDVEEICHEYKCSRLRCDSMSIFLSRIAQLFQFHQHQQLGAQHHGMNLMRTGILAWHSFHKNRCWHAHAERVLAELKLKNKERYKKKYFKLLCIARDKEKEKRGEFESMTPPPIIVQPRFPEGTRRPPLSVSFQKSNQQHLDDSTITGDDATNISMDSLDNGLSGTGFVDDVICQPGGIADSKMTPPRIAVRKKSPASKVAKATFRQSSEKSSPTSIKIRQSSHDHSGGSWVKSFTKSVEERQTIVTDNKNVKNNKTSHAEIKKHNQSINIAVNTVEDEIEGSSFDTDLNDTVFENLAEQGSNEPFNNIGDHTYDTLDEDNHFRKRDSDDRRSNHHDEIRRISPIATFAENTDINDVRNDQDKIAQRQSVKNEREFHEQVSSPEVSSIATNDSYLPMLQEFGSPSKDQLPLSYRLYASGTVETHSLSNQPALVESDMSSSPDYPSTDGESIQHVIVKDSASALPLSHMIYMNKKKLSCKLTKKEEVEQMRSLLLSSDSECSDDDRHFTSNRLARHRAASTVGKGKKSDSRLLNEVNRLFRRQGVKRFVSLFYKWKHQIKTRLLLKRVFSHAMTLWYNRYQRRYSSVPFHLLRHIMNIWKFSASLARQKRQDSINAQRALMYRGISLLSKVFVKWASWTQQSRKKNQQLLQLEQMTKQVCFLGFVTLFQKLLVRYDRAREHFRLRCKGKVFEGLFNFAVSSQERMEKVQHGMIKVKMKTWWRRWMLEHKCIMVQNRTKQLKNQREHSLKIVYLSFWKNKFSLFRKHKEFMNKLERAYVWNKAKRMFLQWPGRKLSMRASDLRRKNERNRSRLLAIVQGKVVVPFSMRNKDMPSPFMHGAFSNKFNENHDEISITSSVSSSSEHPNYDSEEENQLLNTMKASDKPLTSKSACRSKPKKGESSNGHMTNLSTRERRASGKRQGLFLTAPLLLPPTPSYYKPRQYYTTTVKFTSEMDNNDSISVSQQSDDRSMPLSRVSFQHLAVTLGYSNGRVDCKRIVRQFMQEIVIHWRVYSKRHKDVRCLGQFLQSCTKLRCLSKRFYHWLVRSSALAHRKRTWILPNQKQIPYYQNPLLQRPRNQDGEFASMHSGTELNSTLAIKAKNNLSLGYAPPQIARAGNLLQLVEPYSSHRKELPISNATHVLYEQEENASQCEEQREDMMDPFPLRSLTAADSKTIFTNSASNRRNDEMSKPCLQPLVGVKMTQKPTHDQLYEVGKFYLGYRNVQYSHIVASDNQL